MTIRVAIADDQSLIRGGFHLLVDQFDDLEFVGEAADGLAAVALAGDQRPDVMLMDVRMPHLDGIEATARITRDHPEVKILVLTTFDLDEHVYGALRAGASGFLLKDAAPEQVVDAIRVVAAGEALLAPSVTRRLIDELARRPDPALSREDALAPLTAREREVLTLVAAGLTNAEIAERLVVSPATSKTHVSRIMAKLGARDRAQLVVLAYESGLVSPGAS